MKKNKPSFTLGRDERLKSRSLQDKLFAGGRSHSLSGYPLRAVFLLGGAGEGKTQMMVSVPKRHLRHAVDRNRCKRQVREAYRLQKNILADAGISAAIAFIWTSDDLFPSSEVGRKVGLLLHRIAERYRP